MNHNGGKQSESSDDQTPHTIRSDPRAGALWNAAQMLPSGLETGFFRLFLENSEYGLAWRELAASGKEDHSVSEEFWSQMADIAQSMKMRLEARQARNRAKGNITMAQCPHESSSKSDDTV